MRAAAPGEGGSLPGAWQPRGCLRGPMSHRNRPKLNALAEVAASRISRAEAEQARRFSARARDRYAIHGVIAEVRAHRGHHRQLLHGALDDQSAIGGGSFCAIEAAPPRARALGATGKPYPITARTRVGLSLEGSPLFHSRPGGPQSSRPVRRWFLTNRQFGT
jgi:hypothetical protein